MAEIELACLAAEIRLDWTAGIGNIESVSGIQSDFGFPQGWTAS